MIKRIQAFIRGMSEFRLDCTWADPAGGYTELDEAYDRGRELAHRFTFRQFERN